MTPKRVALITGTLGTGGAERQLLTLANNLDRSEFSPEIVSLKRQGPLGEEVRRMGLGYWCAEAKAGFDLPAIRRLAQRFSEAPFDVVLAANQYCGTVARIAAVLGRRPSLMLAAFHSSPAHVGAGVRDKVRLMAYRAALRGYDRLIYVGLQQRLEWDELGFAPNMPSDVIYNGVDLSRFEKTPTRNVRAECGWLTSDYVVGLCAALRPEKRPLDLVNAVAVLHSHGLPVRLLIIGDGPERSALEQRASALGLQDRVRVTGLQADVAPFIHACDVMALVSSVEAFSIAVLEAMACGKPMVLTRVGGAAEQIEPGRSGYLVDVGAVEQIASSLEKIWMNGEAPTLGRFAQARVRQDFSLQRMVQQYSWVLRGGTADPIAALPAVKRVGAATGS